MIEYGHGTHVGLRRDHNEDTYVADAQIGLWLVADGMGGHDSGEVASAIARDTVVQHYSDGRSLTDAICEAAKAVAAKSESKPAALSMGTTLVASAVKESEYEVAWVGDSRVYHFGPEGLKQLTSDHSFVQELVKQGAITPEQARHHPQKNVVTQALGVTEPKSLRVDSVKGSLSTGEMLLLCSDGLTEEVEESSITAILRRDDLSTQERVDHLILAALDNGGSDNVTVLLLHRTP